MQQKKAFISFATIITFTLNNMKKRLFFAGLALLTTSFFVSCSNDDEDWQPSTPPRPTMNVEDSLAIVAYYHSMKCAEWKGEFHWDLTDYETWGGIQGTLDPEKNEYRITRIETPWAPLFLPDGYSLPPELGNLTRLEELVVWGDNRAEGGIPPEIFNCPLRLLYVVDVNQNHGGFSGTLSSDIGKLANTLQQLTISGTSIGGEIPEEVGSLQNLVVRAMLDGNNFTGKVPLSLRDLPYGAFVENNYLTELDWRFYTEDIGIIPSMRFNHLSGEIPDEVVKSDRWGIGCVNIYNQAEGYGFDEKYFPWSQK